MKRRKQNNTRSPSHCLVQCRKLAALAFAACEGAWGFRGFRALEGLGFESLEGLVLGVLGVWNVNLLLEESLAVAVSLRA